MSQRRGGRTVDFRCTQAVITDLRHFLPPRIRHANKTRLLEGLVSLPNVSGEPWQVMAPWYGVVCVHAKRATRFRGHFYHFHLSINVTKLQQALLAGAVLQYRTA